MNAERAAHVRSRSSLQRELCQPAMPQDAFLRLPFNAHLVYSYSDESTAEFSRAFVSSRSLPGFAFLLGSMDSGSGADALNARQCQTYRAEAVCARVLSDS